MYRFSFFLMFSFFLECQALTTNEILQKGRDAYCKEHKKDGVYYSKLILEKNPKISSSNSSSSTWLSVLDTKKKDDLADCFLQGLWYLKNNQFININSQYHIQ